MKITSDLVLPKKDFSLRAFRRCQRAAETSRRIYHDNGEPSKEQVGAAWQFYDWPQSRWPRPKPGDKPKRVAIVAKGPSHAFAPWGRRGWEFWGLNEEIYRLGWEPIEAHTRWFQLHPPRYLKRHHRSGIIDLNNNWREDRGVRLYMDRAYKMYPNSEPYPKQEVEALTSHGRYHTISLDWMIALAILEGFKEIALYGVNLYTCPVMNGESLSGRASVEYWSGVAEGRGARVTVFDDNTDLFRTVHLAYMRSDLQYGWDREPGRELGDGWRDLR